MLCYIAAGRDFNLIWFYTDKTDPKTYHMFCMQSNYS